MVLERSDLVKQMNLPQIKTDKHHQYVVLRELRRLGDYDREIPDLDPPYHTLLKEATLRIPCLTDVKDLQALFRLGDAAILQRTNRADVVVKYKTKDEDLIYMNTKPGSFLGDFVQYARAGNAPLAFYFWAGVALLSAACRRKVCFQGAETIYLNMYIILGAARAAGKGQALRGMLNVMNIVNSKLKSKFLHELKTDPNGAYDILDQYITHIPSDITPEAMVTLLHRRQCYSPDKDKKIAQAKGNAKIHDATGILALDELGTFLGKDSFNASKKPLFLTEIKESDVFNKVTKKDMGAHETQGEQLFNTAVTMIACCAPDWLSKCIDRQMLGGGFTDRCTWIYRTPDWDAQTERSIASGAPKNPLEANKLADWLIKNVLSIKHLEGISPTPATGPRLEHIWQDLVESSKKEFEKFGLDDSKNSASRVFQGILQLSCLLAVSDLNTSRTLFQPIVMTVEHVDLATAIIMKEEASMASFLEQAGRSESTARDAKIFEFITDSGGCVQRSSLAQKFRGQHGMDNVQDIDTALNNMLETEELTVTSQGRTRMYRTKQHSIAGGCERCR